MKKKASPKRKQIVRQITEPELAARKMASKYRRELDMYRALGFAWNRLKARYKESRLNNYQLRQELHAVTNSRNILAKLVDPKVVVKLHDLEDRNFKLELAMVLTRQMAKLIRHSWADQGYPTDAVDAFEDDLKRILGMKMQQVTVKVQFKLIEGGTFAGTLSRIASYPILPEVGDTIELINPVTVTKRILRHNEVVIELADCCVGPHCGDGAVYGYKEYGWTWTGKDDE